MCSLCEDKTHTRSQCPFGYIDSYKAMSVFQFCGNPFEACSEDSLKMNSKGLLRDPQSSSEIKKKVAFNEKTVFTTFDAPLSDNAKPVYDLADHPKDVTLLSVYTGDWWDKDEEETNELYNFNKEINCLNPNVNDFDSLRKTVFTTKEKISESRIKNYKSFHNPSRFLVGEFLTSSTPTPFLRKFPKEISEEIKKSIGEILSDFQNDLIEVYPLYLSSSTITKGHLNILKQRIGVIDRYLLTLEE